MPASESTSYTHKDPSIVRKGGGDMVKYHPREYMAARSARGFLPLAFDNPPAGVSSGVRPPDLLGDIESLKKRT